MQNPTVATFIGLPSFLDRMFVYLTGLRVDVSGYLMDHVCYRVETRERYEELKRSWSVYCDAPYESLVNGRPITVLVLRQPFEVHDRMIRCIELPAPKEGSSFKEGWEHAEFVIDEPFQHFMSRYEEHESRFDRKGLGKKFNPELGLKIGGGLQVKFHHQPLAQVIEIEKQQGVGG